MSVIRDIRVQYFFLREQLPEKYISVSVEEYSFAEWESVYNEFIKDKDNVVIKPGYTNPKTFQ